MDKKIFLVTCLAFFVCFCFAEFPAGITQMSSDVSNMEASINATADENGYVVRFFNNSTTSYSGHPNEKSATRFTWYLSYKEKRVSDYYETLVIFQSAKKVTVYSWPGEVPRGHEKYVIVKFGKEQLAESPKDRRD